MKLLTAVEHLSTQWATYYAELGFAQAARARPLLDPETFDCWYGPIDEAARAEAWQAYLDGARLFHAHPSATPRPSQWLYGWFEVARTTGVIGLITVVYTNQHAERRRVLLRVRRGDHHPDRVRSIVELIEPGVRVDQLEEVASEWET